MAGGHRRGTCALRRPRTPSQRRRKASPDSAAPLPCCSCPPALPRTKQFQVCSNMVSHLCPDACVWLQRVACAQTGTEQRHRQSLVTDEALLGGSPAAEPVLLPAEDREREQAGPLGPGRSGAAAEAPVGGHEPPERGPWELLKFTLPTLGVWVVNPCAPFNKPHRALERTLLCWHAWTTLQHICLRPDGAW